MNNYQQLAMRTNDGKSTDRLHDTDISGDVVNACMGLSGEVGEVNDILKKHIFHGHSLDETELKKEIGDILWYVAVICDGMGYDMDDIMQMNIDKLRKRYP